MLVFHRLRPPKVPIPITAAGLGPCSAATAATAAPAPGRDGLLLRARPGEGDEGDGDVGEGDVGIVWISR